MLRDTPDAQIRVSQAEAVVRSARLFLFDSLAQLWTRLLATGEVTMEARALARLAASHAVNSAVQAVDLMYVAGGATSIYVSCPLERAFRDVHTITQHIGVHPRGHAVDWPGAVRPRTGYPASLTAAIPTVTASAVPCSTPIEGAQSSSTPEAFVKTFEPITCVVVRPDAVRVLRQLNSWFQHCNSVHPHKGLAREFLTR